MNFDDYKNHCPYMPRKQDAEMWEAYRREESRLHDLFKADLFQDLGIEDNPKREKLFEIAWREGHSSGYAEVYGVACGLVELIQ